eukprot:IDg16346t1
MPFKDADGRISKLRLSARLDQAVSSERFSERVAPARQAVHGHNGSLATKDGIERASVQNVKAEQMLRVIGDHERCRRDSVQRAVGGHRRDDANCGRKLRKTPPSLLYDATVEEIVAHYRVLQRDAPRRAVHYGDGGRRPALEGGDDARDD